MTVREKLIRTFDMEQKLLAKDKHTISVAITPRATINSLYLRKVINKTAAQNQHLSTEVGQPDRD